MKVQIDLCICYHYIPIIYELLDPTYIDLENPGMGQLSSSESSHERFKKMSRPLGSLKQVATKSVQVYYLENALHLFHNF